MSFIRSIRVVLASACLMLLAFQFSHSAMAGDADDDDCRESFSKDCNEVGESCSSFSYIPLKINTCCFGEKDSCLGCCNSHCCRPLNGLCERIVTCPCYGCSSLAKRGPYH